MVQDWNLFLDPYVQVVSELKVKFRGIHKQNIRSKTFLLRKLREDYSEEDL
ncbi:MAG: hypothetical protein LBT69_02795 [Lactobacillales bacterium]|jgi:ppGpp synthetase/RelA/SpoT-type nucleotidyltranferase|nr:hypothetical protein [Lactobacillales bacterium]